MNKRRQRVCLAATILLSCWHQSYAYDIGVYYYPGWSVGSKGSNYPQPWVPIKAYPEREPMLGWYSDSDAVVLRQQVTWMHDYGLKFVVFDWYWNDDQPFMDHAIKVFKRVKTPGQMGYAVMWANHFRFMGGQSGFEAMARHLARAYFADSDYLKINGKPVLFIFSLEELTEAANLLHKHPADLVAILERVAVAEGLPGVHLVAETAGLAHWVRAVAPQAGFAMLSGYNYHIGYSGDGNTATSPAKSYKALRQAYRVNWDWILQNSALPYIVPNTAGWDSRPWGGLAPENEQAMPTSAEFEAHLREAKAMMDKYPDKTRSMGVICCWNEFGEGSYIEPTKKEGFSRLEKVKKVFGEP